MDLAKKLEQLEAEVQLLRNRISELEAQLHRERTKWIPYGPIPNPVVPETPIWPAPGIQPLPTSKCSKCGLEFNGPMGYCCPRSDCPTGLGSITC